MLQGSDCPQSDGLLKQPWQSLDEVVEELGRAHGLRYWTTSFTTEYYWVSLSDSGLEHVLSFSFRSNPSRVNAWATDSPMEPVLKDAESGWWGPASRRVDLFLISIVMGS